MIIVCEACQLEMKITAIGFDVIRLYTHDLPYNVTATDVYSCPGCGHKVYAALGAPWLFGRQGLKMLDWLTKAVASRRKNIVLVVEHRGEQVPALQEVLDRVVELSAKELSPHDS